jgi:hypothetical protein
LTLCHVTRRHGNRWEIKHGLMYRFFRSILHDILQILAPTNKVHDNIENIYHTNIHYLMTCRLILLGYIMMFHGRVREPKFLLRYELYPLWNYNVLVLHHNCYLINVSPVSYGLSRLCFISYSSSKNIIVVLTTIMLNLVKHAANVYETCQGVNSMASGEIYFDNCQLSFIKKTIGFLNQSIEVIIIWMKYYFMTKVKALNVVTPWLLINVKNGLL